MDKIKGWKNRDEMLLIIINTNTPDANDAAEWPLGNDNFPFSTNFDGPYSYCTFNCINFTVYLPVQSDISKLKVSNSVAFNVLPTPVVWLKKQRAMKLGLNSPKINLADPTITDITGHKHKYETAKSEKLWE